jgi:hypothetical protein
VSDERGEPTVPDRVVIDEWTIVVRGDPGLSSAAADRLRDVVERELAVAAHRVNALLAPVATVELLPR